MTGPAGMIVATGPLSGLTSIADQPFLRYAFVAGACIAAASGLVGYFVVLRSEVFTGDPPSHVAFTGALAALAAGADLRVDEPVREWGTDADGVWVRTDQDRYDGGHLSCSPPARGCHSSSARCRSTSP